MAYEELTPDEVGALKAGPDFAGGMDVILANLKALLERVNGLSERNARACDKLNEAWADAKARLDEIERDRDGTPGPPPGHRQD